MRPFVHEFVQNHRLRVQKLHFQLTCMAQRHGCFNSLIFSFQTAANAVYQPTKNGDVGQSDTTSDEITNRSFLQTKQTDLTYNDHLLMMTVTTIVRLRYLFSIFSLHVTP